MTEKNIIEITSEGLWYVNENEETQFINFENCYQRYLDRWNNPDHVGRFKEVNPGRSDEELNASLERIRARKEVGRRDYSVPYISFYTDPSIRFDFSDYTEFRRVEDLVQKAGWRTFDAA
jgi:hypothetical protein